MTVTRVPAPLAGPPVATALMPAPRRSRLHAVEAVVRRRWPVLVAATAVAGAIGYATAAATPDVYEARAQLLVGPLSGEAKTLRASSQLTETYAELAGRRSLLVATARDVGRRPGELRLRAAPDAATRLLTISDRQTDPRLAARVANAHTAELMALTRRPTAGRARAGRLQVVEAASPSGSPVGPPAGVVAALAALAGLLAATAAALVLDRSRGTVGGGADVEAATGAPCVGVLTRATVRAARGERPVVEARPHSAAAAEFGVVAAKLDAVGGQSLLVIALDGDAPALARNLAAALAAQGSHVALVDVGHDGAGAGAGEAQVAAIRPNGTRRAHRRRAGRGRDGGAGAVHDVPHPPVERGATGGGHAVDAALRRLEERADVVVLHASGLDRSPTVLAWARATDGTIIVAQRHRTAMRELRETAATLRMVGAPVVGTVLAEPATAWPRLRRRLRTAG
jgi:capsular polysaccharide biosynthesis protein